MDKSFKNIEEFLNYIAQQDQVEPSSEEGPQPPLEEMFEENHEHFFGINFNTDDGGVTINEICGYTPIQEISGYDLLISEDQARDLFIKLAKILV